MYIVLKYYTKILDKNIGTTTKNGVILEATSNVYIYIFLTCLDKKKKLLLELRVSCFRNHQPTKITLTNLQCNSFTMQCNIE